MLLTAGCRSEGGLVPEHKSIASFKGDLSNVTAPPFILAQKSATEFPAAWCSHQPLFLAQGASSDAAERALAVLKNFLASLKTQTYTGSTEKDGAKKPLNAFLGELFIAEFEGPEPRTRLISEQVSHHPPVTACYLYNKEKGISAEGYVAQETSYSATSGVTVKQVGHALIRIESYGEEHLMTLPTLSVKGVVTGNPYPELSGTCHITSTSGYCSKIDFEGKKMMGLKGSKNSVHAEVYHIDSPSKPLYEVNGTWNSTFSIRDCNSKKDLETIDVEALEMTPLLVPPETEQDPWETRRAWAQVLQAIQAGDVKGVADNKHEIEEAQRGLRREEEQAGTEWERVFYRRVEPEEGRMRLLRMAGEDLNAERTNGVWQFVGVQEAEGATPPYHAGLVPTGRVEGRDS
ncbi:MAG: hypothetical protein Q9159_003399 [Coniocarpon cinnabarinum]